MSEPSAALIAPPGAGAGASRFTGERVRDGTVTPRALLIGLLMIGVTVAMVQAMSIRHSAADVAGEAPPPAPTYLLFFYVLLAGPLLGRIHRRLALSRGELLLIYVLMLIAGPITHPFGIGFLLPHTTAPAHFIGQEPDWEKFWPALPPWLGPRDPQAVMGFYRGTGGTVPWLAWATPLVAWASLLIALFFVTLCINVLFRKQYVEHERLTFPLTAIPLAITDPARAIFRQGLFWVGLAIPLFVNGFATLSRYIPSVPALQLRDVLLLDAGQALSPPWNGLGEIYFSLSFWLVGVVYLIPKEIGFSAWFFYLVCLAENVFAVAYGHAAGTPDVYSNSFPALYAQGAGAAFALTGITLYAARHHLSAVGRKVFRRDSGVDDRGEFLSYRTAFWGMAFGVVFLVSWLCVAGMRPWVALLLLSLILAYFFIFARVRAETGLGMGVILWPKMLDETMLTVVGSRYLTLPDLTVLFSLRWLYFAPAVGSVMACQLEGFKLADAGALRGRAVGWLFAVGATATVVLALVATLKTYYGSGFELLPLSRVGVSMVGNQCFWSYGNLVAAFDAPKGPEWGGICAIGVGALVTMALSYLRVNFLGFPLHPVGYLAANSWGMHLNWMTFLIGWLIKTAVTRYGGLELYRRLLPLFLGMIVGDMVHQGVWGMVAWATGGVQW
jgi:hypothetical protein